MSDRERGVGCRVCSVEEDKTTTHPPEAINKATKRPNMGWMYHGYVLRSRLQNK